jgi:hypothetical protein
MHLALSSIPTKIGTAPIRSWFPIVMLKNGSKVHPYVQMLEVHGLYYTGVEYEEKFGKKVKQFMKELIRGHF